MVGEPIEHAYVILANGKSYRFAGDAGGVDPSALGESLKGAIVSHNHPIKATEYSFSKQDVSFFEDFELDTLRGFDELYEYELTRKHQNVEPPKPLTELTEYDWRHEELKRDLEKRLIGYVRRARHG